MLIAIVLMLQTISIKNKVTVEIFLNTNGQLKAYVAKNEKLSIPSSKIMVIDTEDKRKINIQVEKIDCEPSYYVLQLRPLLSKHTTLGSYFCGNSKISGYIYTDETKLSELVFSKWLNLHL
jgi:hypothetical protein